MPTKDERKRRTWTRTRRGCKTCRIRHVKCDETYPFCKRCSTSGRKCDGCVQPSNNDQWEINTVTTLSPSRTTSPSRRPSSGGRYDDGRAESCFAFFEYRTLEYLTDLLGHGWKPLMLRAAEMNDAIYHAVLAIGSIHKTTFSKQSLNIGLDEDEYAVKAYTRSLRLLALDKQSTSPDVVLAACVLFIGFENIRRNYSIVLEHIQAGVLIIQQHQNIKPTTHHSITASTGVSLQNFIPAFARLERQYHELTGNASTLIQSLAVTQASSGFFTNPYPQPIPHFSCLSDAWKSLHQCWHILIAWVGGIYLDWFNHMGDVHRTFANHQGPLECSNPQLEQDLALWYHAFAALKQRTVTIRMPSRDAVVSALLEIHYILADTILGASVEEPQVMIWDKFTPQFSQILTLCDSVIQNEILLSSSSGDPPSLLVSQRYAPQLPSTDDTSNHILTFDMGILMPLVHVLTKSRSATVRMRAIRLLEAHPRLEGLWSSALIAKLGRVLDRCERSSDDDDDVVAGNGEIAENESLEAAAARGAQASEIPFEKRVLHVRTRMRKHVRSAEIMMYRAEDGGPRGVDLRPVVTEIEW